jgi:protein SCO1/2
VTAAANLAQVYMPMGSNFGDIDNHGFLDMYVGTGRPSYGSMVRSFLLRNRDGRSSKWRSATRESSGNRCRWEAAVRAPTDPIHVGSAFRRPLGRPKPAATFVCLVLAFASVATAADKVYTVKGMVTRVDLPTKTIVVSHERIVGLMDAMVMPFEVKDAKELQGVTPGAVVEFRLTVGDRAAYASGITVKRYESVERDPSTARRLATMKRMAGLAATPLAVGSQVPDFTLIDQTKQPVTFSSLAGRVVAVNFIYTRCALPQFCLRISNNFGVLQKRFAQELSRGELVLLTITFDPERDTPEALAAYASQWKADPKVWHFLTGPVADVRRVNSMFGVDFFPDEGLFNHSLRTAVIDRRGRITASIEGNQYTPEQLGDLVLAQLTN